MGLRAKLLVTLLGLLVLTLGVLGGGTYWLFDNKLRSEALSYQRNIASQLIIGARAELTRVSAALKQLSEKTALLSEVEPNLFASSRPGLEHADAVTSADHTGAENKGPELMRASFDNFLQLNHGIAQVILFDPQGQYLLHSPSYTQLIIQDFDVGQALPNHERDLAVGNLQRFESGADGRRWLVSAASAYKRPETGELLGYIVVVSSLEPFRRMIAESDTSVTGLFFSDDAGNFLARSPKIPFLSLPDHAVAAFVTAEAERAQPPGDDFSNPLFVDLTHNELNYRLSIQRVSGDLWLGSMIGQQVISNNSRALLAVLLPVAGLILMFTGVIFYWKVAGVVLNPIAVLIQATRRISGGDYRPHIDIRSDDEMGELAEAFRVMGRQLEESRQQIAQLAYYDPLTELPNRTTLRVTLNAMIDDARRNQKKLAVLFIDLDDFKKVNDRLGHAAGDELLVQVGQRLQRRLRSSDVIAEGSQEAGVEQMISRRGGDEFNAILNNVHDAREAALVAERLIADINEPLDLDGSMVTVGASVGVALFPEDGEDADTLLRHADMAMYEAKSLGKNKYYLFTESINSQVHERLELEQSIANGLHCNEFEVHYQPKVDLKTLRVTGFEALIRWDSPGRGLVSPAEFIPLAEESQLIYDIGHWMMAETLHQIRQWRDELPEGLRIAINISARQMAQENFAEHLITMAEQFEVPLSRLEVELTETSILIDEVLVRQHLYALRTAGVKVSLDDFGTGYSSLTFLRSLPIDTVKIDRSFVMRLSDHDESRAIVLSVLELCRKLSLRTVAEGIERRGQFEILRRHGCDEGQGYLFARPMSADLVLPYLRSRRATTSGTASGTASGTTSGPV